MAQTEVFLQTQVTSQGKLFYTAPVVKFAESFLRK